MKRRSLLATALTTAASLLVIASPAQATASLDYVALGDSFSAGSGILPLDTSTTPLCARTTRNYPHAIATAIDAKLTDVTCGGAQTTHFTTAQYPGLTKPQFDALSPETDLVTLTIGGNDASLFIGAIAACGTAGLSTAGFGSPCKKIYGDSFDAKVDSIIYPAVKKSLSDLRAKAPNARVAILGYPWVLPATTGCFLKMPVARGDVPYVRALQAHLNRVIETAAGETGATFVDMAASSDGHDACAPARTRWVEPALWGTNFVPIHPNATGEAKMAEQAMSALSLRRP